MSWTSASSGSTTSWAAMVWKIKTIGDSYMCAAGVPASDPQHALKTVLVAFEVRELMDDWKRQRRPREDALSLRIGVHSGPVVAGVVGKRKFAYDIWGHREHRQPDGKQR